MVSYDEAFAIKAAATSSNNKYRPIRSYFSGYVKIQNLKDLETKGYPNTRQVSAMIRPLYVGIPCILLYTITNKTRKPSKPGAALFGVDTTNTEAPIKHNIVLNSASLIGSNDQPVLLRRKEFAEIGLLQRITDDEFVSRFQESGILSHKTPNIAIRGILTPHRSVYKLCIEEIKFILSILDRGVTSRDFLRIADVLDDELTRNAALDILKLMTFVPTDLYEAHPTKFGYYKPANISRQYVGTHLGRVFDYSYFTPLAPSDRAFPRPPHYLDDLKDTYKKTNIGVLDHSMARYQKGHPYKLMGLEVTVNDPADSSNSTRWVHLKQTRK